MRTTHATQFLALLLVSTLAVTSAQNITMELMSRPEYSTFAKLMVDTEVVNEAMMRQSLTFLLPDNSIMDPFVASHPSFTTQMVADVLRYHVLLQYFGAPELAALSSVGYTVTTLYQTTGRAMDLNGFVNLTKTMDGTVTVGPAAPMSPPEANVVKVVDQYPYNYSFVQISAVLEPMGLMAVAPTPAPAMEPVMAPMESPMESPMTGPVSSPPVSEGPVAEGPGSLVEAAINSAYAVGWNAGAVVAALASAAMLL